MISKRKITFIILTVMLVFGMILVPAYAEDGIMPIDGIDADSNTVIESESAPSEAEDSTAAVPPESCEKGNTCPLNKFIDANKSEWYHDGIHFCLDNKIMNGTGENEFNPDGTITRAMIVTMLYRLEGEPAFMNANVFSDVEVGSYYEKAVVWASGKGIVKGYSYEGIDSDEFGPYDNITREQFAAIMYRYAKYKEYDMNAKVTIDFSSFKDTDAISSYALEPVKWACGAGIINGNYGKLNPSDHATRAQAAAMFHRFTKHVVNKEKVDETAVTPPVTPGTAVPDVSPGENVTPPVDQDREPEAITLKSYWKYAGYSKIHSGSAVLYYAKNNRNNIVIGVNAGHGTIGGSSQKTYCHPDMTPKTTGGSTAQGAIMATAIAGGMTFADGTPEYKATLAVANKLKDKLLAAGYDVLMVRDGDDVQLDNIARTVICNNVADCHVSIHFDSDGLSYDKGCFYISTPDALKKMEPVSYTWEKSDGLGKCLIAGLETAGVKLYGKGSMAIDLTQTSYSTVPSIDIELGNQKSVLSDAAYDNYALGLLRGINEYYK